MIAFANILVRAKLSLLLVPFLSYGGSGSPPHRPAILRQRVPSFYVKNAFFCPIQGKMAQCGQMKTLSGHLAGRRFVSAVFTLEIPNEVGIKQKLLCSGLTCRNHACFYPTTQSIFRNGEPLGPCPSDGFTDGQNIRELDISIASNRFMMIGINCQQIIHSPFSKMFTIYFARFVSAICRIFFITRSRSSGGNSRRRRLQNVLSEMPNCSATSQRKTFSALACRFSASFAIAEPPFI